MSRWLTVYRRARDRATRLVGPDAGRRRDAAVSAGAVRAGSTRPPGQVRGLDADLHLVTIERRRRVFVATMNEPMAAPAG